MALYQKHRPDSLEDLKGNKDLKSTLTGLLSDLKKCPHVFLITGETGCGKTTIGRIISKELGIIGMDFRELDGADFRGIDTVRDVRKQAQFKALEGDRRMWLLDEVHQLTGVAQEALLKLLEDTTEHVYFVLCTTEPQKLKPTLKNRCSLLQVNPLSDHDMMRLLRNVCRQEGEKLDKTVYEQIIQDSLGRPRNALTILEQVLAVDDEQKLDIAKRSAEIQSESIALCRTLIENKSWKYIMRILQGLKTQEAEGVRRVVLGYCQAVLLKSDNTKAGEILEAFEEPFFNIGFPGLVLACYRVTKGE